MIKSVLALSLLTLAHSWYPFSCCGKEDCRPVPCSDLKATADGDLEIDTYVKLIRGPERRIVRFPKRMISLSQDDSCHICIQSGLPQCVFVPIGS